jgi:plastocyanin
VLFLAACGDDDDDGDEAAATTTTDRETSSKTADDGGGEDGAAVTIASSAFEPQSLEVTAGTTVTWTNEDGFAHTVTAGAPGSPEDTFAESLEGGDEAEITFDEAGTFPYFCNIHPSMTGEVVVS